MQEIRTGGTKVKILDRLRDSDASWSELFVVVDVSEPVLAGHLKDLQKMQLITKVQPGAYRLTDPGRLLLELERKKGHFLTILELAAKCDGERADNVRKYLIHLYPDLTWINSTYGSAIHDLKKSGLWKKLGDTYDDLSKQREVMIQLENDVSRFLDEVFGKGWAYKIRYRANTGWFPLSDSKREAERLSKEMELPELDPELKYTPNGVSNYSSECLVIVTLEAWKEEVDHALKMLKGASVAVDELGPSKGAPFEEAFKFIKANDILGRMREILQECHNALISEKEARKFSPKIPRREAEPSDSHFIRAVREVVGVSDKKTEVVATEAGKIKDTEDINFMQTAGAVSTAPSGAPPKKGRSGGPIGGGGGGD